MIPVVTPAQMRRIDDASTTSEQLLIERAGMSVAWAARALLGGVYGRRVMVLAGPGNNGADGRVAGRILAGWGLRVDVIGVDRANPPPGEVADVDLLIDAAFGTGFSGVFVGPTVGPHTKVLAVDIPSGVDGLTGRIDPKSNVLRADVTVTFAARKPGLLLGAGAELAGRIIVADIGLDVDVPEPITTELVDDSAWPTRLPQRSRTAHKWTGAVLVIAGSPGMTGAAHLCSRAAARAGTGLVRLAVPGDLVSGSEIVGMPLPQDDWAGEVLAAADRCRAIVLGPGLGRRASTMEEVHRLLTASELRDRPMVIDGDALSAVTEDGAKTRRAGTTILTPHDGEFTRLHGDAPGDDRIASAKSLAARLGVVVLLKGPTTVVAGPEGRVALVRAGDERLATAGSGDVLAGIIGSFLAAGLSPEVAASTAAAVHGAAAQRGRRVGLLAGDLPDLVADVLSTAS